MRIRTSSALFFSGMQHPSGLLKFGTIRQAFTGMSSRTKLKASRLIPSTGLEGISTTLRSSPCMIWR